MFEDFLGAKGLDGVSIKSTREEIIEALRGAEEEIEGFYGSLLRPMAMYIGATGLIPEGWNVEVIDAEALEGKFPGIEIEKKQKDGMFLVAGDTVIGVFPEVAYFSTPKGVEAAKAISASSEE
jgi:hypothetical protein